MVAGQQDQTEGTLMRGHLRAALCGLVVLADLRPLFRLIGARTIYFNGGPLHLSVLGCGARMSYLPLVTGIVVDGLCQHDPSTS